MVADNINLGGTAIKPVGWDRSIIYNFKMLLLFSNLGPRSHIFVNCGFWEQCKQIQQYFSGLYVLFLLF